jgi:hypothetical protein
MHSSHQRVLRKSGLITSVKRNLTERLATPDIGIDSNAIRADRKPRLNSSREFPRENGICLTNGRRPDPPEVTQHPDCDFTGATTGTPSKLNRYALRLDMLQAVVLN